jgi:hypothetical protein
MELPGLLFLVMSCILIGCGDAAAAAVTVERMAISNWMVFAPSSHQAASASERLSAILKAEPDWCAVAIFTNPDMSQNIRVHPRATLLSADSVDLRELKTSHVFKKSLERDESQAVGARRMLGYLFAIKNGAKIIFDGDLDVIHKPGALANLTTPGGSFAFFSNPINPYAYYGQPSLWPRGLPLEVGVALGKVNSSSPVVVYDAIGTRGV